MEWLMIVGVIYLIIGFIKAMGHISSGRVGSKGVLATMIAITLLWPIL